MYSDNRYNEERSPIHSLNEDLKIVTKQRDSFENGLLAVCRELRRLDILDNVIDHIDFSSFRDTTKRGLAMWWAIKSKEDADDRRNALTRQQALAKLTGEERTILGV
jgi:hypothetical protein